MESNTVFFFRGSIIYKWPKVNGQLGLYPLSVHHIAPFITGDGAHLVEIPVKGDFFAETGTDRLMASPPTTP